MILPSATNRVRYELKHKAFGAVIIPEPIGWSTDEKEFARNKKFHGIIAKFSNNLKFYNDGANFINLIDSIHGVNAEITLTKYERHPITDDWELIYSGNIDLTTKKEEDKIVSVKFNSGGFDKIRKSRFSKKIEIDRTTDLDGNQIPALQTKEVVLEGRKIYRKSIFNVKEIDNSVTINLSATGSTRRTSEAIPLNLISNAHEEVQDIIYNTQSANYEGKVGQMFFALAESDKTIRVKFDLSFLFDLTRNDEVRWASCNISVITYENGSNFDVKYRQELWGLDHEDKQRNFDGKTKRIVFDKVFSLNTGDSLALIFHNATDINNFYSGHNDITLRNITCDLSIEEESYSPPTTTKAILAHELGERLTHIITGKQNAFYSEYLGRINVPNYNYTKDGDAGFVGFSHGMWVRQFTKNDELFKSFTTSWKDFDESMDSVFNMGLGIETIGNRDRIRYEPEEFFYQNHVTIKLGKEINGVFEYIQPNKIKRTKAKEYLFSGIEIGCEKGGEYEEVSGLDEYNAKATFSTPISKIKNIYKKVCKYRIDPYGQEFARRKSIQTHSTEDYRTDKEIFMNDLKRSYTNKFRLRTWQDDFQSVPTGVFSPETATNLRFSPINSLLRHSWVIAASSLKYMNDYIRYNSSVANSELTTRLRPDKYPTHGGKTRKENGDVVCSDLFRARFVPEWIEFEFKCDFFINRAIQGSTTVLGRTFPNFYGLVEFKNEVGDLEKGFLFSVKPNGKGKFKLLKANR